MGRHTSESGHSYAKHRLASIHELNQPVFEDTTILESLGPMGGLTGTLPYLDHNELETGLYVTSIEGHIRCPWKHFLSRQLGLVDIDEEQIGLPNFQSNTLGNVVHEYLEFWVNEFRPIQNNIDDIGPRLKEPPFIAHWHSTAEEKPRSFNHQALLDKTVSKNLDDVGQLFLGQWKPQSKRQSFI